MTRERMTLNSDGGAVVKRGGGFSIGSAMIGLGILGLVAVILFIIASANRDQALRTDAVTSAASDLAAAPSPVAAPKR